MNRTLQPESQNCLTEIKLLFNSGKRCPVQAVLGNGLYFKSPMWLDVMMLSFACDTWRGVVAGRTLVRALLWNAKKWPVVPESSMPVGGGPNWECNVLEWAILVLSQQLGFPPFQDWALASRFW